MHDHVGVEKRRGLCLMKFNPERFEGAAFEPRTKQIKVESLRDFFDAGEGDEEGAPCIWTVRGLTGDELARCWDAEKLHKDLGVMLEGVASRAALAKKARAAFGLDQKTTQPEVAKRLEMLSLGSVDPQIDLPTAVKLAEHFPIEFFELTHAITELTGLGSSLKKPEAASQATAA
jgi:hypothetical protein